MQEAMKMVDYMKPVLSKVKRNGLVCENESMFYKIKALINCPKYEAFQPEFYDLDPDNISPELEEKINKMYRKAVASGDITGTDDGEERVNEDEGFGSDDEDKGFGFDDEEQNGYDPNPWKSQNYNPAYSMNAQPMGDVALTDIPASGPVVSTFTCLYTAIDREGGYKTGKFYSNASSSDTARIDAVSKLAGFGYKNIEIVAVENGSVSPVQMANGDVGEDIKQVPPEEQAKSEEPKTKEDELPATAPVDLTDDEKLQMFNDWFTAFKSTLYDMDAESLSALNDEQKQEFWTRLKTKTVEMSQDPRTFISKSTMDKLESGTFPREAEPENPVSGETADDDAEVQAALGTAAPEAEAPEGDEGPGDTGNEPVFNGGADNGGMEEVTAGGGNAEEPAAPPPVEEQPAAEQPQAGAGGNEEGGNEEEEEEVVTEDEGWGDDAWDYSDFNFAEYLKDIPIDDTPADNAGAEDLESGYEEVFDYEPTEEPAEEEPVEQFGVPLRKCFYNVVREKNPYNGDGPFAEEGEI